MSVRGRIFDPSADRSPQAPDSLRPFFLMEAIRHEGRIIPPMLCQPSFNLRIPEISALSLIMKSRRIHLQTIILMPTFLRVFRLWRISVRDISWSEHGDWLYNQTYFSFFPLQPSSFPIVTRRQSGKNGDCFCIEREAHHWFSGSDDHGPTEIGHRTQIKKVL
jgi:hypothetical protein